MTKELYEFACAVYYMRKAQQEYNRLRYSQDVQKRGEAGENMREMQKQVDEQVEDIITQYEMECL